MAVGDRSMPRNFRCFNPGNIRRGQDWQGLAPAQLDPEFAVFTTPVMGFRALCRVLLTYGSKHGLKTVRGIISRWAPPSENDTEAYIRFVSISLGVKPDDVLDLSVRETLQDLALAIARKEGGRRPDGSDWWAAADIARGAELASGVVT